MRSKKMEIPKFASESEEADWWAANPEFILQEFERGEREGKVTHGTIAKRLGLTPTVPMTIRISQEDLAIARARAEKRGLRYQTYMKMLLHEALAKGEG